MEWFRHDQAERARLLLAEQLGQGGFDPLAGVAEHFTLGRADNLGLLLPLAKNLGMLAADFFDLHALPQAVIDILQVVDFLDLGAQGLGHGRAGLPGGLVGRRIDDGDLELPQLGADLLDLGVPLGVERDIERTLNASLFVVVGRTRTNQHDLDHELSCVLP